MQTSYFRKMGTDPNAVCISRWAPSWLPSIKKCIELAPSTALLAKWRDGNMSIAEYTAEYTSDVLDHLDAKAIVEILGPDAILCCYEKSGEFCHRHMAAAWLQDELGIEISEAL